MPLSLAAPRPLTTPAIVVMLTLLLGIQPVTTDLYLPALPTLQRELGATVGAAQLTLSALIIAFGFGQLVCGPLADRFGRRPVLLRRPVALHPGQPRRRRCRQHRDADRLARGAGRGDGRGGDLRAGRSCATCIEPAAGARMMSRALTGLGVIAVPAPPLGGLMVEAFGWRPTLLLLAVFGAPTLLLVACACPRPCRGSIPAPPGRAGAAQLGRGRRQPDLSRLGRCSAPAPTAACSSCSPARRSSSSACSA